MNAHVLKNNHGLSFIELLIVMLIIGILAGIAIPSMITSYEKAIDKRVISDMRTIVLAVGLYRVDFNFIPQTVSYAELVTILNADKDSIAPIVTKDAWGHSLSYTATGTSDYTLISYGKDGQRNFNAAGKDFNANADTIIINGIFVAHHE